MKNQCDFPAFTAYCLEDNILHVEMKKINSLSAQDVEQIFDCHKKIGNGDPAYVLATFAGYIPMSHEAMVYSKKRSKETPSAATAYVVNNYALRVAIKFFMNFHKPNHPMNICSSKSEALLWLKQEKKKNSKKLVASA